MLDDLELLLAKQHFNPHSFLGLHQNIIRVFNPGKKELYLKINETKVKAILFDKRGLFIYELKEKINAFDYKIFMEGTFCFDPYVFKDMFSEMEIKKFLSNKGHRLYKVLGAHLRVINNVKGVQFAVFAPKAKGVSIIGEFNNWNGRVHQLRNIQDSGLWLIFLPSVKENQLYKFEVTTKEGDILVKSDPFAFFTELRPHNSSVVYNIDKFEWEDASWLEKRKKQDLSRPINIYEVHLQSWIKGDGYFFNYRELAHRLCPYLKKMNFNYVEVLPLMEHPLDDSWGYQVTGFFSVTSRYGSPEDFQYFVNYMHKNDIGVILDWVPAHFPKDKFALRAFDGTFLFEYDDFNKRNHPQWETLVFNFEKRYVQNFLISSALFFLDKYHIDGLRVDAISSIIYLDYARKKHQWERNKLGTNLNLEGIDFLKNLNNRIHEKYPDVLTIAEEATSFKGVTNKKNLNFDLKWNMGWMTDTLNFFQSPIEQRIAKQKKITFPLMYLFNERFMLPFSHDEVVHMKNSLFNKIKSSDMDEKFANLRLLYSYMICFPGKKLSFMGNELAQKKEWDSFSELQWDLLKLPRHKKYNIFVSDLNHLYLSKKAFFEDDFSRSGFKMVGFFDEKNLCMSYLRIAKGSKLLCVHNFFKKDLKNYFIKLKGIKKASRIFNTDDKKYGGKDLNQEPVKILKKGLYLNLRAFTTLIFEVEFDN